MLNFTVTFFITIANLLVLFLILKKLLWKPVTDFMEVRAKKIKDSLSESASMRSKAEEISTRYDALMAGSEAEAERLVKEGEERAAEEAASILAAAQASASEARKRGEEAAARERDKAMEALAGDIARLAAQAAAKLVGREAAAADEAAAAFIVSELEAERAR